MIFMEQGYELKLSDIRKAALDHTDIGALYIPLHGKNTTNPEEEPFDLAEKIQSFFVFDDTNPSDPRVMLLMGDTGSGKSMFAQQMFQHSCKTRKEGDPIPLWIPLTELLNPFEGAVEEVLKKQEFSESQIAQMKERERFIFIVDGYDELHQFQNSYVTNKWGQWKAKVLITCRSQALYYQKDPDKYFVPFQGEKRLSWLLQKLYVAPFSKEQISVYVKQYQQLNTEHKISEEDFTKVPGLTKLIATPFLLHLAVEALPDILANQVDDQKMTQAKLYDVFIERWFTRQVKKLEAAGQLKNSMQKTKQQFWDYCKKLAQQMHANELSVIPYSQQRPRGHLFGKTEKKNNWESFFNADTEILRSACPLNRMGEHHYGFIHASFVEYFATRAMYEEIQEQENEEVQEDILEENKEQNDREATSEIARTRKPRGGIHYRVFAKEPNGIRNLADRIEMSERFKQKMLNIVEASKKKEQYAVGAANAISALVSAGVVFNGANLRGIKIAGADLSGGYFDTAGLESANLDNVNMSRVWLRNAKLMRCQLAGLHFGEYPWFKHEENIACMDYRSDINRLVTASKKHIYLWDIQSTQCIKVLKGHEDDVRCVQFSDDGKKIVSGSNDKTVRVWDLSSGKVMKVLIGHEDGAVDVKFSSDGLRVVSAGGLDNKIRIWDIESAEATIIVGDKEGVHKVKFSREGKHIVSCEGGTVKVWDIDSKTAKVFDVQGGISDIQFNREGTLILITKGQPLKVWDLASGAVRQLHGHQGMVNDAKFSKDGMRVVSVGAIDKTVRLWELASGKSTILTWHEGVKEAQFDYTGERVITRHEQTIQVWDISDTRSEIMVEGIGLATDFIFDFQLNNHFAQVVSAPSAYGRIVKVWNMWSDKDRELVYHDSAEKLMAKWKNVTCLQLSSNATRVVLGFKKENTVEVWDLLSSEVIKLQEHETEVKCVLISENGQQVVSCNADHSIRIWEVNTKTFKAYHGHKNSVTYIRYSNDERKIVSGDLEGIICVWDLSSDEMKMKQAPKYTQFRARTRPIQFNGDGSRIAFCSLKTITIWDLDSGEEKVLSGQNKYIKTFHYSEDGAVVAAGTDGSNLLYIWDVKSSDLKVLQGHESQMTRIQISSRIDKVITSEDKTIRVWDIISGQQIYSITLHSRVNDFYFSDSLESIVIGFGDGSVQYFKTVSNTWESLLLYWSSIKHSNLLLLAGSDFTSSQDLSQMNRRILEQRGAKILANSELITQVAKRSGSPVHNVVEEKHDIQKSDFTLE